MYNIYTYTYYHIYTYINIYIYIIYIYIYIYKLKIIPEVSQSTDNDYFENVLLVLTCFCFYFPTLCWQRRYVLFMAFLVF